MSRPGIFLLLLFCSGIGLFPGCKKQSPNYVPPNAVDSFVKDPYGSIYINGDQLYKLDIQTGVTEWTTYNVLAFASFMAPLYFDSGYFYSGSLDGIATYNYQTGQLIWLGYTPATAGMDGYAPYRVVAIKDSLAIYAGSTGVGYGQANMYCVRKRNGTLVWQNTVDTTGYLTDFTSIPYIADGNVVTLTRNYNGDTQITAYDPVTGKKIWATANNDNLQSRLLIGNHAIYNVDLQNANCYSASDGSLLWSRDDLPTSGYYLDLNCFLDGDKLIVAGGVSPISCTVNVYNTANGSLLSSQSFALPLALSNYFTFNYSNNVLYTSANETGGTVNVHAYDINAQKEKWTYRFRNIGEYGDITTPDFMILPEARDSTGSYITFLDIEKGTVVKKVPFSSSDISEILYTDSTGNVYSQPKYWKTI
jgi:outer membrane protein assembly factor BamB